MNRLGDVAEEVAMEALRAVEAVIAALHAAAEREADAQKERDAYIKSYDEKTKQFAVLLEREKALNMACETAVRLSAKRRDELAVMLATMEAVFEALQDNDESSAFLIAKNALREQAWRLSSRYMWGL